MRTKILFFLHFLLIFNLHSLDKTNENILNLIEIYKTYSDSFHTIKPILIETDKDFILLNKKQVYDNFSFYDQKKHLNAQKLEKTSSGQNQVKSSDNEFLKLNLLNNQKETDSLIKNLITEKNTDKISKNNPNYKLDWFIDNPAFEATYYTLHFLEIELIYKMYLESFNSLYERRDSTFTEIILIRKRINQLLTDFNSEITNQMNHQQFKSGLEYYEFLANIKSNYLDNPIKKDSLKHFLVGYSSVEYIYDEISKITNSSYEMENINKIYFLFGFMFGSLTEVFDQNLVFNSKSIDYPEYSYDQDAYYKVLERYNYSDKRKEYKKRIIEYQDIVKQKTDHLKNTNKINVIWIDPNSPLFSNLSGFRTAKGIIFSNTSLDSYENQDVKISFKNKLIKFEKFKELNTLTIYLSEKDTVYTTDFKQKAFSYTKDSTVFIHYEKENLSKNSEKDLNLSFLPDIYYAIDDQYLSKIEKLNKLLYEKDVPLTWLQENINHEKFKIYNSVKKYFATSPERKVQKKEKDHDWYRRYFGVEGKIRKGKKFIKENLKTLKKMEALHGIDYEITVAVLGMETNFGEKRQRGNFNIFSTLVSQYLLIEKRERFAINELANLYHFSKKIEKPTYYFIGSYAGASGWGQFIPSSQKAYFIDSNGKDSDIDIYSVEDNLFSIQNYLYKHGLRKSNQDNPKKLYNAVYAYNHSDAYVKAVLYIYEELKKFQP